MSSDLLIVGAGILGTLVADVWRSVYPTADISCETRSRRRHSLLQSRGYHPRLSSDPLDAPPSNLVISVAPSGNDDYAGVVGRAASLWNGQGTMVFTSSNAVYSKDLKVITEKSETVTSERAKRLLDAEQAVLKKGGNIIRLAGLYKWDRGPHSAYLKRGKVSGGPDGVLNLISYDDAAMFVVKTLQKDLRGQVLLCSDGSPMTREEIVRAAQNIKAYQDMEVSEWGSDDKPKDSIVDCSWSRQVLNWAPKDSSFQEYAIAHRNAVFEQQPAEAPT